MLSIRCLCLAALCLLFPLSSCRRAPHKAPAQEGTTEVPRNKPPGAKETRPGPGPVSSPVTVAALMSRTHFAFRTVAEEHIAWHDTYTARVSGGGLTVTPQQTRRSRGRGGRPLSELVSGAPLTVRLIGVTKGGRALTLSPGAARVAPDGAVERDLGLLKERYLNGEAGVTLSWTFESAPAGAGDLELRLQVSGARHVGSTGDGQHYAARSGDLGVRAGPAAWKDAAGKDKQREVRRVRGELHLAVPGRFVTTGVTPLRMELALTPEQGLDQPIQGSLRVNQEQPAVAAMDTGYMVVWRDFRGGKQNDIWAARVSKGGKVLDPSGFLIRKGAASSDRPVVARGKGGQLLVAWEEHRGQHSGFDIMATRVTRAGTVLDPQGIIVCGARGGQMRPQISFDGQRYLLVWEEGRSGRQYDIHGARVDTAGKVLDPGGFPVSTAGRHKKHPAVCHSGNQALVVWTHLGQGGGGMRIRGARVDAAGEVLDLEGIAVSGQAGEHSFPAVGCDGGGYLVLWQHRQPGDENGTDIHGARVDGAGKVLDPGGRVLVQAVGEQEQPALIWREGGGKGGYLAVWQDRRASNQVDVYGARLDAGTRVLDRGGRIISSARSFQEHPAVATDGQAFFVAWQDRRHGSSYDIYGARVSAAGLVQDVHGINVSGAPHAQVSPRLAAGVDGRDGAVIAWQDFRGDGYGDVLGARLSSAAGKIKVVDPAALALSRAPWAQQTPDLASAGEVYLVVWQDRGKDAGGDIVAALVSGATGKVKAIVPVAPGAGAASHPAAGYAGGLFWVVWQEEGPGGGKSKILGARLNEAGEVLDQAPVAMGGAGGPGQISPRLAAGPGQELLVVWQDRREDQAGDIRGGRVNNRGEVLDPAGIVVSGAAGAQTVPAVSRFGDGYLVVWQDEREAASGANIFAARVSAGGQVLDPAGVVLSEEGGESQRPALAWDGSRALVAWQGKRGGDGLDILGTVVAPGAKLRGGSAGIMVLAGADESELSPSLSKWGAAGFVLGYQRFDPSARSGASRVEVLTVDLGEVVTPTGR